jgi:flagellar motor switch protein FliN/FliY
MSDAVVYEQFDQAGAGAQAQPADADLRRLSEVPVEASVEIGRTAMTVGETLELCAGTVVVLDRLAGEPVDLLVNGTRIARGEVVVVDEQFGMRVTAVIDAEAVAVAASAELAAAEQASTVEVVDATPASPAEEQPAT